MADLKTMEMYFTFKTSLNINEKVVTNLVERNGVSINYIADRSAVNINVA